MRFWPARLAGPLALSALSAAIGCSSSDPSPAAGSGGAGNGSGGAGASLLDGRACASRLPTVQSFEPARAEHGRALLQNVTLGAGLLPEFVVRNLWVAWGTPAPATDEAYWNAFRDRYGMLEAPFDNGGLPLGMRREASGLTFDCLVCHAGRVAGTTVIGAPNTRVDLESFYDDLLAMRDLAPQFGFPQPPVPYDLDGLTSAAGAQDAFGIGFRLAKAAGIAGVNTEFGPERAPAWWLLRFKQRMYVDGSADASGHRATMATLVAFGVGPDQLAARESDFVDITHFIRSIEPPCWGLTALDSAKMVRGEAVFNATCASCHGNHTGAAPEYPNKVVDRAEVGTDPMRAERFGPTEASYLNASWFGQPPLRSTGGYLAPPLAGVWARAPYLHNGSVPDLRGVIDPAERPARWKRTGTDSDGYDAERVGFRHEAVGTAPDPDTREGRLVYDTTRPGMGNAGHRFGEALTDAERSDLLEYLRGL